MLHLLPIRLLLTLFAFATMFIYASSLRAGWVATDTLITTGVGVLKIATPAALIAMSVSLALWRWTPLQKAIFPYLGGIWKGDIEFESGGRSEKRPGTLEVIHTLTSIRFVLSTEESTSETLVVHARKPPDQKNLVKLVYIYEVQRREGFAGAGDRYRGCAFLDVSLSPWSMTGSYMAGAGRTGTIRMRRMEQTPFWQFWR